MASKAEPEGAIFISMMRSKGILRVRRIRPSSRTVWQRWLSSSQTYSKGKTRHSQPWRRAGGMHRMSALRPPALPDPRSSGHRLQQD